jgi:hypothetical protein
MQSIPQIEDFVPTHLSQTMARFSGSFAPLYVFVVQANSEDFSGGSSCGVASLSVPLMVSRTMW